MLTANAILTLKIKK